MPFKKLGGGVYQGPSGRKFNSAQVRLYYAGGNHFPGQKGFKGRQVKGYQTGGIVASGGGPQYGGYVPPIGGVDIPPANYSNAQPLSYRPPGADQLSMPYQGVMPWVNNLPTWVKVLGMVNPYVGGAINVAKLGNWASERIGNSPTIQSWFGGGGAGGSGTPLSVQQLYQSGAGMPGHEIPIQNFGYQQQQGGYAPGGIGLPSTALGGLGGIGNYFEGGGNLPAGMGLLFGNPSSTWQGETTTRRSEAGAVPDYNAMYAKQVALAPKLAAWYATNIGQGTIGGGGGMSPKQLQHGGVVPPPQAPPPILPMPIYPPPPMPQMAPRRGTDTVPAMLTPGEMVLTRAQQGAVRPIPGRARVLRPDQRAALNRKRGF